MTRYFVLCALNFSTLLRLLSISITRIYVVDDWLSLKQEHSKSNFSSDAYYISKLNSDTYYDV